MRAPAVLRALRDEVTAAGARRDGPVQVLDVGGGSGGWAVPLARLGCVVTVVDPSPNALATLRRRAEEASVEDLITAIQGDTDDLPDLDRGRDADLVLGHALLEVVENAEQVMTALARAAAPGAAVSLLAANRVAALLGRVMVGRLSEARFVLDDPAGRTGPDDPLVRRFDLAGLVALVEASGLTVEQAQGDGVLLDLAPAATIDPTPGAGEQLAQLELDVAARPPLREFAARLHVLARRRG